MSEKIRGQCPQRGCTFEYDGPDPEYCPVCHNPIPPDGAPLDLEEHQFPAPGSTEALEIEPDGSTEALEIEPDGSTEALEIEPDGSITTTPASGEAD